MDASLKQALVDVYRRYGFYLARDQARDGILVFTLKTGYFDNADIVRLSPSADTDAIFQEFTSAGYACTVRDAKSPESSEEELFRGFFSVDTTRTRLLDDYQRFTSNLVAPYGKGAKYQYIKAPYQIDGKDGLTSPPEEVLDRIDSAEPILFLIEAAAGFGKTCTAQEIVNLLAKHRERLPLYAELSRNRQARIFRYILLDEIDRTFPLLSSGLVQTEIRNGRIATILDGFDELLRKNDETGSFENKEPMLETVSELLTGRAKVIITTRRTVLFDGDEFHKWLDRHAESFRVVRIRIQEPRVIDWLVHERLEQLVAAGLKMDAMANPVLLSYLRCIDDETFAHAAAEPEGIVESYFGYMLDRERERQDLRMTIDVQSQVLKAIAGDMMALGYTAEQRDYIVRFILESQAKLIDDTRNQYSVSDKPTREEIANKLASHALLDRSSTDPDKIGFVNDFAFGNYVAANIITSSDWLSDDMRFIDPAVRSTAPRGAASREALFTRLTDSLPYLDTRAQIEVTAELVGRLPAELLNGAAEGIELTSIAVGNSPISDFQFNECTFRHCEILRAGLSSVTFLNCRFYQCVVTDPELGGPVYMLGCASDPDLSAALGQASVSTAPPAPIDRSRRADSVLLRKFWPIGESTFNKPSRPIFRLMKFLCQPTNDLTSAELYSSVERLKKRGILSEMSKNNLITLNLDSLALTQEIFEAGE